MQITGNGHDRELSVFEGSCDNLVCVKNVEGSGNSNTAAVHEFVTVAGVSYYFLLSGKTFNTAGGFNFLVS